MSKKKVVAIIPARMAASRFPGKPLAKILDLPMIEHVRRRVSLSKVIDQTYVATCDKEIFDVVNNSGGKAVMTKDTHQRCTDRVDEAAMDLDADIVVIVQGDEPLFDPQVLEVLVKPMFECDSMICTNLLSVIEDKADLDDIDIVKAVINNKNDVMYFSRSPIPYFRVDDKCPMYRQTGISAFTKEFLHKFSRLDPTPKEVVESVDFLRILEHGYSIRGVIYSQRTVGVDREDDVASVEDILRNDLTQKDFYEKIAQLKGEIA
ncbi:MAG: 3-deoxy-manno-octulosonate cytidylyltransferase [Candidatus Omnitrophica bacterium]|nr:3-deoxy-manno-octulosonate cytidylyltransferase [Candidatus Omnitrophota bacterium]